MEPLRPTPAQAGLEEIGRDLDRIEGAVAAGQTDLGALGFWPIVGWIKRDPAAAVRFARDHFVATPGAVRRWFTGPVCG